jgi:hypothetical protein
MQRCLDGNSRLKLMKTEALENEQPHPMALF